ncbi:MAG: type VII secretion protein EccE, partial [Dactylosporangium sp.]|nr:type VII secretion protein EccE [Dactylosporangium sp.]NNJ59982.1 type VII secretion protein EccE [Dactylosporangium sp.]
PAAVPAAPPAAQSGVARASAAVAQVPQLPEAAPAVAPRTPSELRIRLPQVLCWQAATLLVLLAMGRGPVETAVAATVAGAVLLATVVPWRGHWLYWWLWLRLGYLARRRHFAPGDDTADPRRFLIGVLEPAVVLGAVTVNDETGATIAHPAGLTAVLEVRAGDHTLFAPVPRPLPMPWSVLPVAESGSPPTVVQLIVQIGSPPVVLGDAGCTVESYRTLTGGAVPARRRSWIAVQVRRTPEAFHDTQLRPALVGAVKRVRRRLRQKNLPARLLTEDNLLTASAIAACFDERRPGQAGVYGRGHGHGEAHETWRGWTTGQLPQTSYRISRWPDGGFPLDQLLRQVPATAVTLGMAALRDPAQSAREDDVELEMVIRLAATNEAALKVAGTRLAALLHAVGGAAERLDGRHRAALLATVPFGGFLG